MCVCVRTLVPHMSSNVGADLPQDMLPVEQLHLDGHQGGVWERASDRATEREGGERLSSLA